MMFCTNFFAQGTSVTVHKDRVKFHDWNTSTSNIKVFLVDSKKNKTESIPIIGSFVKKDGDLIFTPKFSLLENVPYLLQTEKGDIGFSLKTSNNNVPIITAVYPTADELPENLLRMYIQFSSPMKTVGNLEHIKLINEQGEEVKGAIFNNVYELWDDSQTQLTIIFDPARVKTGLRANETLGRALEPEKTFHLVIDELENIYGKKLAHPFTKTFKVVAEDIISPSPDSWEFMLPKSNDNQPLTINFLDAVDKMSLLIRIQIYNDKDQMVQGKIHLKNQEKTWEFVPENDWNKGKYLAKINSRLADPSGNNLNGLFDHTIGSLKNQREGEIVEIAFQIE